MSEEAAGHGSRGEVRAGRQGTPESQARRLALVGSLRDPRAEYPLGALLARGLITQDQHDAGVRYAKLRGFVIGNPNTRNQRGHAAPLDNAELAHLERQWRAAAWALGASKPIVDHVCVSERMPSWWERGRLRTGLTVLAKLFGRA